jgi:two-component system LytT family sensor kinase
MTKIKLDSRTILLHISCWLCYIAYELYLVYHAQEELALPWNYVIFYAINISLFYSQLAVLDFTFKDGKPADWRGILLFAGQALVFLLLKGLADFWLAPAGARIEHALKYLPTNLIRGAYFCILAVFFWVAGNIAAYRRRAAAAERHQLLDLKEKAELAFKLAKSQNAFLCQQLNPHMLFNALNFIYSSVEPYSAEASHCVLLLSDIMRYSLDAADQDEKTLLAAEVEQLQQLITLHEYRYGQLYLETRFAGNFGQARIIPLLLTTLAENIFKHGIVSRAGQPAKLTLLLEEDGTLRFFTGNYKRAKAGTGLRRRRTGLENTRTRLDHSYPGAYRLDARETEEYFELDLMIRL